MPATRRLILIIIILFLLLLFLVVPGVSWSQTAPDPWQDSARELAKKIVAITGPRQTVALAVRNISSLSDSEVAAVRLALEAELRAASLRFAAKSSAAPELRITLSENLQGLLWIAEFLRDNSRDVAMISNSGARAQRFLPAELEIRLNKQLVIEFDKPILDFSLSSPFNFGEGELLLLTPEQLLLFKSERQAWVMQQSTPIPSSISWPRDPRGRLERDEPSITAYLPGMKCEGITWQSTRLDCTTVTPAEAFWNLSGAAEDPVAARFLAQRNFFEGPLPLAPKLSTPIPPFFNVALIDGGPRGDFWLLSEMDARVRVYADASSTDVRVRVNLEEDPAKEFKLIQTLAGWGSELAAVRSSCGRHEQLLATRPGDWTETDEIQAYELADGKLVAVSAPVQFPGPITALWPGDMDDFAHAVVRNLKTNRYEAYTLTLSCGR